MQYFGKFAYKSQKRDSHFLEINWQKNATDGQGCPSVYIQTLS